MSVQRQSNGKDDGDRHSRQMLRVGGRRASARVDGRQWGGRRECEGKQGGGGRRWVVEMGRWGCWAGSGRREMSRMFEECLNRSAGQMLLSVLSGLVGIIHLCALLTQLWSALIDEPTWLSLPEHAGVLRSMPACSPFRGR